MIDVLGMYLTNQLFTYRHRMWQIAGTFNDDTVDIINSNDEIENVSKEELERILTEVEVA